jgi:hypothetical protein
MGEPSEEEKLLKEALTALKNGNTSEYRRLTNLAKKPKKAAPPPSETFIRNQIETTLEKINKIYADTKNQQRQQTAGMGRDKKGEIAEIKDKLTKHLIIRINLEEEEFSRNKTWNKYTLTNKTGVFQSYADGFNRIKQLVQEIENSEKLESLERKKEISKNYENKHRFSRRGGGTRRVKRGRKVTRRQRGGNPEAEKKKVCAQLAVCLDEEYRYNDNDDYESNAESKLIKEMRRNCLNGTLIKAKSDLVKCEEAAAEREKKLLNNFSERLWRPNPTGKYFGPKRPPQ